MSVLKQNRTNGKTYNYFLIVSLPTGKARIHYLIQR